MLRKELVPWRQGLREVGHLQRPGPPATPLWAQEPPSDQPQKGAPPRGSRTGIKVRNKSRSSWDQRDCFYSKTVSQTSLGQGRLRPSGPLGLLAWTAGPPQKTSSKVITLRRGDPRNHYSTRVIFVTRHWDGTTAHSEEVPDVPPRTMQCRRPLLAPHSFNKWPRRPFQLLCDSGRRTPPLWASTGCLNRFPPWTRISSPSGIPRRGDTVWRY